MLLNAKSALFRLFLIYCFTFSYSTTAMSQSGSSSLLICLNKNSQNITVKTQCNSSEIIISGKNLSISASATPKPVSTPAASASLNLAACYSTSAKKGGSTFDGRMAIGVFCRRKTDLLINDQVTAVDSSGAKPVIERKQLAISGKIPNGVEYGMIATAGVKKFYEVQVTAVCCPVGSGT